MKRIVTALIAGAVTAGAGAGAAAADPSRPAPAQTAVQLAGNSQYADASATSTQIKPKNTNVSVRVLSPGNDGDVTQQNSSTAIGVGLNKNETTQTATQEAGRASPVQAAEQIAKSEQDAAASAESRQIEPENVNVSVRVLSPGDDADVSQQNSSFALGIAANKNDTDQSVTQEQGGRYGDVAVQAAGQIASNDQDAWASAESKQIEPENSNLPVRTLSRGDEGEVSQKNSSTALALSLNVNDLVQTADQSRSGGERKLDAPDQAVPELDVREPEKEDDESVSQLNKSLAAALSANLNQTTQTATQSQEGKGDVVVQAAGQVAGNEQEAGSKAESLQFGARNENGRLSGPDFDLCKHDFCKPEKPDDCKRDRCKPDPCKRHDWKLDRCKPKPCDWPDHRMRCKDERRPMPLEAR